MSVNESAKASKPDPVYAGSTSPTLSAACMSSSECHCAQSKRRTSKWRASISSMSCSKTSHCQYFVTGPLRISSQGSSCWNSSWPRRNGVMLRRLRGFHFEARAGVGGPASTSARMDEYRQWRAPRAPKVARAHDGRVKRCVRCCGPRRGSPTETVRPSAERRSDRNRGCERRRPRMRTFPLGPIATTCSGSRPRSEAGCAASTSLFRRSCCSRG